MKNILVTGGSGTLGSELVKLLPDACFPDSKTFNVTNYKQMDEFLENHPSPYFTCLIHCAAFISPPKIEENPIKAVDTNIIGTANVVKLCEKWGLKLIYISTDYVFDGKRGYYNEKDAVNPVNKYAWSKLGGECAARLYDKSLIIRLSFGPKVFPYDAAFIDQITSRESVDKAAQKIVKLAMSETLGIIHIGQNAQTVYEYAKSLDESREIKKISIRDMKVHIPENTALNTTKYNNLNL